MIVVSASFSGLNSTGTITTTTSLAATAARVSAIACKSPRFTASKSSSASPGSWEGHMPLLIASTTAACLSQAITLAPLPAKWQAMGNPMFPTPITVTFVLDRIVLEPLESSAESLGQIYLMLKREQLASSVDD